MVHSECPDAVDALVANVLKFQIQDYITFKITTEHSKQ